MYLATIRVYNIQHIVAAAVVVGPMELSSNRPEMEQYVHDHDVAILVPGNWYHQQGQTHSCHSTVC
jgi:hypothetical protein